MVFLALLGWGGMLLRNHVQIRGTELKAVGMFRTRIVDLDGITDAVIGYSSGRMDTGYTLSLHNRTGRQYSENFSAGDLAMILVHLPQDRARCHRLRTGGMNTSQTIRLRKAVVAAAARTRRQPPESCLELEPPPRN